MTGLNCASEEFLPDLDALENKAISHSLSDFSFSKAAVSADTTAFMNATYLEDSHDNDDDDDFGGPAPDGPMGAGGSGNVEDFFGGDQGGGDDYGGMDLGGDDDGGFDGGGATDEGDAARPGTFEPMDPRRIPNEHDLMMAMTEAGAEGGSLDYFDQSFLKNWAGPEHWKLRKVVRRRKTGFSKQFDLTDIDSNS